MISTSERWTGSDRLAIALACLAGVMAMILFWMTKTSLTAGISILVIAMLLVFPIIHFVRTNHWRIIVFIVAAMLFGLFGWYIWPKRVLQSPHSAPTPIVQEEPTKSPSIQNPVKQSITKNNKKTSATDRVSTPSVTAIAPLGIAIAGNNYGTNTVTNYGQPECVWKSLTKDDYINIARKAQSSRTIIHRIVHPSDDDASLFSDRMASALDTYGNWDTSDFKWVSGPMWVNYPGITIIVGDKSIFEDKESPASRLKAALEEKGIQVHTQIDIHPKVTEDIMFIVGSCK